LAQMNHSELSHMAGAVDDSTINIVEVIIIIIIILGFKFPKNRQKWPSISMFERPRTDSRRMTSYKTDVIGLQTLGGRAAYTIYSVY